MSDIFNEQKSWVQKSIKVKGDFQVGFMDIIPATAPKGLTSQTTLSNNFLIFDSYSKISQIYGMERITTEEVMDKLDMFQSIFEKIDKFGWWYLEIFSADASTQLTSMEFQNECQTRSVHLVLAAPEHQ